MFLYMHFVESFNESCRTIEGISSPKSSHPPLIERSEKVSRLGERVFAAERDEAGDLPDPLFNNLQDRQTIFGSARKFEPYIPYLAECYCGDPDGTIELHEAVKAGEADVATYREQMEAIASKLRLDSPASVAKRAGRLIKNKLL